MTAGDTAQTLGTGLTPAVKPPTDNSPQDDDYAPDFGVMSSDSGEAIGMSPARLTLNFGFGAGLFVKDGKDRYGLASRRPVAFVDMPRFVGDQMIEERTGGDLSIQACAEDPQVAFHAVRQLARIAEGVAQYRWVQTGFRPTTGERHLLGFSNGKGNPPMTDSKLMDKVVWVGDDGPDWMRGGTYLVARRIRFAIEHWDHMPVEYQEKAIGEVKYSHGKANADGRTESPPEDDGEPSHLRIVTPDAFTMVRRSYSYNNGLNFITERWPPWRQGLEYDAGMLFICYQRDPRTGFISMYDKMAKNDAKLNQFWTHEGSGLFACPGGAKDGEFVGQGLFKSA
jgi:deferrochelatase/peroxidase EfeB